ncbi:hypothetical protein [Anoxybacillus sp. ST4]|uniref:hypothetical protein n=1 Tax=Anoxybacillus sp. ST4 TaxID=2864181 RepID=UPI001C644B37|nr:hypothetical protein [Anoxybacillus sp. ST4]
MKKWMFSFFVVILSACNRNVPITEHSQGVWDHYFVYPMSKLLLMLGHVFSMGASSVPAALSLYWVVGGCFSIVQSLIMRITEAAK